jgi:hypothetical protein
MFRAKSFEGNSGGIPPFANNAKDGPPGDSFSPGLFKAHGLEQTPTMLEFFSCFAALALLLLFFV